MRLKSGLSEVVGPFEIHPYCILAYLWHYGSMAEKKAEKKRPKPRRKKKRTPKPDVNQLAAQIVRQVTNQG